MTPLPPVKTSCNVLIWKVKLLRSRLDLRVYKNWKIRPRSVSRNLLFPWAVSEGKCYMQLLYFHATLYNLVTQYFSQVLKNITDVCSVYWCWDSLVRLATLACLWTESFSPPKWFKSNKSFPVNDLCMMRVIRLWIQTFLGQTRTFPSRGQRIYSK